MPAYSPGCTRSRARPTANLIAMGRTWSGMPALGMVGGGQLARMTQQAAIPLGVTLRILADSRNDSAALVSADITVGHYRDFDDLRVFASSCDVVTFDHEHVPPEHLRALANAGVALRPPPEALLLAQDKRAMRERLGGLGFAMPRWRPVTGLDDVTAMADETGWPVVLKGVRGGYDGKGVWVAADAADAERLLAQGAAHGT